MAARPDLIYCAGGNRRFAEIAIDAGFLYGSQLPETVYFPIHFADQDWKKPNRERYMTALEKHRPNIATVLDWEQSEQLPEVLAWAEEAAQFVDVVMIIPKVINETHRIPATIGGRPIRLGYSIPTKHGGTQVPLWEFGRRPVHLLGGNPGQQMKLAHYLNVGSVDGNMMQKLANYGMFWTPGQKPFANKWTTLLQADGERWEGDAPYEAFRRSCKNIMEAWDKCFM